MPAAADALFENAIVEALNNTLEHNVRDTESSIHCAIELVGRSLTIRVLDEAARSPVALATPAGLARWPEPTMESWESIPESGYGLYLMRAVFPEVRPVTRDGRHRIEMELTFSRRARSGS